MMGGLHIEMSIIGMIGLLLQNSGCTEAMAEAKLTTPGRAESLTSSKMLWLLP